MSFADEGMSEGDLSLLSENSLVYTPDSVDKVSQLS
jgi:hypothetical protein